MKKIAFVIMSIILAFILLLAIVLIHLERTEWTLRGETIDVAIPIKTDSGTLAGIEAQARREALQRYPNAYLSEITWIAASNEGFENLTGGEVKITYCDNLGNAKGFYNYDRYAFCTISVDLKKREITKIDTYGNFQLNGKSKFETYPDFDEIRDAMHRYCSVSNELSKGYTIEKCYVSIRYGSVTTANFTVRLPNGVESNIKGAMKGLFRAQDGVSRLVFVENE